MWEELVNYHVRFSFKDTHKEGMLQVVIRKTTVFVHSFGKKGIFSTILPKNNDPHLGKAAPSNTCFWAEIMLKVLTSCSSKHGHLSQEPVIYSMIYGFISWWKKFHWGQKRWRCCVNLPVINARRKFLQSFMNFTSFVEVIIFE